MGGSRWAVLLAAVCLAVGMSACGGNSSPAGTVTPDPSGIISGTHGAGSPTHAAGKNTPGIPTAAPRPSPGDDDWKTLPIVPAFDGRAAEIFRRGISMRRDFHAFSKIGDCQNITTYFLAEFDQLGKYRLGDHAGLQAAIDWFKGSFGRKSLAVRGGLNVASVMNPLMADPNSCLAGENPLACELRVHNPSVALISFEEAWDGNVKKYETYMRQVIEYAIGQGVVPIVATKADDLEGGNRINALIARLAWEYDIPIWNFWAAAQPLVSRGLTEDGFHLTQGLDYKNYFFDLPSAQWSGWMARNFTALQALDAARAELIAPVVD